jgi:hypothetical protein
MRCKRPSMMHLANRGLPPGTQQLCIPCYTINHSYQTTSLHITDNEDNRRAHLVSMVEWMRWNDSVLYQSAREAVDVSDTPSKKRCV